MHTSLVGNPLKQLWSAYEKQLERRPVLTQMTTSAVLWGAGDLIAQRLEYWERQNDAQHLLAAATAVAQAKPVKAPHPKSSAETAANNSSKPQMEIDWQRAVLTGLFGALFVGPVGHYWYITLDKLCTRLVPGGGPSRIATKVLIDTAAMGPFYVSAFFAWGCALMDGSGWEGFTRKMKVRAVTAPQQPFTSGYMPLVDMGGRRHPNTNNYAWSTCCRCCLRTEWPAANVEHKCAGLAAFVLHLPSCSV